MSFDNFTEKHLKNDPRKLNIFRRGILPSFGEPSALVGAAVAPAAAFPARLKRFKPPPPALAPSP